MFSPNAAICRQQLVALFMLILASGFVSSVTVNSFAAERQISFSSPFATCTADVPTAQNGTLYPDSEVEPQIAVNPAVSTNLIAVWQQDRWSNGGARGIVAGVSIDGGKTWATIVPPKISKCSGGAFERATDPWVTISPNGRAYLMSLAFMQDRPDGGFGKNAMLVSHSDNGGISWSPPAPLIIDTFGQILNDKNSITADPFDSRYVYAVWDRLQEFSLPPKSRSVDGRPVPTARTGEGTVLARERRRLLMHPTSEPRRAAQAPPLLFKGPSYFTRTTDGGRTWEVPKKIYDPGPNSQSINNLVEVLPNGDVIVFFTSIVNRFDGVSVEERISLGYVRSSDKGSSFGPAVLAIEMHPTAGVVTPNRWEPVRDASLLFDSAVDRENGNIYLVWQDGRWGGIDRIAFSQSTDGGLTWSIPIRINMTPHRDLLRRNQAFIPTVEVGPDHKIVVTYYDFRFDRSGNSEDTEYFAVICKPTNVIDCSKRRNWGDGTTSLKDISLAYIFDMLSAPNARGRFLGDYMGLARRGAAIIPAFGRAIGLGNAFINIRPIH